LLPDRGRLWLESDSAAVADAVFVRQRADSLAHRLRLFLAQVGPACVEAFVVVELVWIVAREVLEEVLPRPGAE
jgi:hypothetical protein